MQQLLLSQSLFVLKAPCVTRCVLTAFTHPNAGWRFSAHACERIVSFARELSVCAGCVAGGLLQS
jgi:hypothetical protein